MNFNHKSIEEFILSGELPFSDGKKELINLMSAIRFATKITNHIVNKAGLVDILGFHENKNVQGEQQQKLDVIANENFTQALIKRNVACGIVSEECEEHIKVEGEGINSPYVIMMDPLDGSSNIDVNVSVGTIFSIFKRKSKIGTPVTIDDFLQKGTEQILAGYIIYGTSTMLVFSTGKGVHGFTLNPSLGTFHLSHPYMQIPKKGYIYSVNSGNYLQFPKKIRNYIKFCQQEEKNLHQTYSSRYIGSLVSDFHRNLIKGGIYMYPPTDTHPNGKLRLLYECNPIAFLTEQAGGIATNGINRILEISPTHIHQREIFYCGSEEMINELLKFL